MLSLSLQLIHSQAVHTFRHNITTSDLPLLFLTPECLNHVYVKIE